MSELALRLIKENKRTKDPFLDLGNCGFEYELPKELLECIWLKRLNLGFRYFDNQINEWIDSKNNRESNKFHGKELSVLKHLTQLQSLDLSSNQIQEVPGLETLTALQSLDLSSNQIKVVSELETLTALQSLDLSSNQIKVVSGLETLTALQSLTLSYNQIQEVSGLETLTALQSLNLSYNQIKEASGLETLTALQSLYLRYNQIQEVSGLETLTALKSLSLSSNQIKVVLGLETLTVLQSLYLSSNQIKVVSGLETLTALQSLHLSKNQIQEVSGLETLKALQSLHLSYNQIKEASGLETLTALQSLDLSSNQIKVVSGLETLTALQSLNLSKNQIQEVSGLETLTALQSLNLSYNQIQEVSGLETLTALQSLYLSYNQIIEVSGLETLTALQSLDLRSNQIQEVSGLETLTALKKLYLRSNQIIDVSGLETLTALQSLHLSKNQIQEVSGLETLTVLQSLTLSSNQIKVVSGLETLTALQSLNLSSNQIKVVSELETLTALQSLNLSSNQIKVVSELETLTALQSLHLSYNQIQEVSGLETLTALKKLYLSYNQIQEVSGLETLTALQSLDLSSNQIKVVSGLETLTALQSLDLSKNQIKEVSGLETLTVLQSLHLSKNQIQEVSGLETLTALQSLNLSYNQIKEASGLEALTALKKLYLSDNQIQELSGLDALTALKILDISENQIQELSGLDALTTLHTLDLSSNQIQELSGLDSLTALQTLSLSENQIQELSGLDALTTLHTLDLSSNQIQELSGLDSLTALQTLSLSDNQIQELSGLDALSGLQKLDISENQIQDLKHAEKIIQIPTLIEIKLRNNPFSIPNEINKNSLHDLRAFFNDLEKGTSLKRFAKLLFLGDGCVGKTTLYNHLKYGIPPNNITPKDRTHGIALDIWEKNLENLKVNVWDFGGQEIFHGTHRLFLGQRALYILVWTKQENKLCSQEEQHPLKYWLDFIADYGKESTVLLVENTIKGEFDEESFPDEKKLKQLVDEFALKKIQLSPTHHRIDCQNNTREVRKFKAILKEEFENLLVDYPIEKFPQNWVEVIEEMEKLKIDKKTISVDEFNTICKEKEISDAHSFLNYLDRIGFISYFQHLYKDVIILQTDWVLDALYESLKLTNNPLKSNKGKLSDNDFNKIWKRYSNEEKELFKSYMLRSEILAEPRQNSNKKADVSYRYLIPSLFTDDEDYLKLDWDKEQTYWVVKFQFVYPALIQRLQVRILNICNYASFFKNYLAFKGFQNQKCLIELIEDKKEMRIWTDTPDFYLEVINLINEIYPLERVNVFKRVKEQEDRRIEFIKNEEKKQYQPKDIQTLTEITMKAKDPIKVFVTYCWTDKNGNNDKVHHDKVHQLVNSLRFYGFDATFDKAINDASTANDFMRMMVENIHKNEKVVVVLSEGYAIKANDFRGGVGDEYQLLIKDINKNPTKYVLVSFEGRGDEIYPSALSGRDTIDLSKLNAEEIERLIRKLEGRASVKLAEIGKRKDLDEPDDIGKLF